MSINKKSVGEKPEKINNKHSDCDEARRKPRRNIHIAAFAVSACMFIAGLVIYMLFFMPMNESSSIAIIGGVDGPTAITVSGNVYILPLLLIMLVLTVIFAFGIYKNRKNK